MKTVDLWNEDDEYLGSVEAPDNAKYLFVFSNLGVIWCFPKKPRLCVDGYPWRIYKSDPLFTSINFGIGQDGRPGEAGVLLEIIEID